jgi:hypothetical protein
LINSISLKEFNMPSYNASHNKVKTDEPLYNSRLISIFIEYIKKHYPDVDIDSILSYAGITNYELEDQGHWFSQRQVDRFHKILSQKTGDPNLSREVGRYAASSKASGLCTGIYVPCSCLLGSGKTGFPADQSFYLQE